MRKLSLVFVVLAVLAMAPAALAECAYCDGENCQWGAGRPEFPAKDCWYEWCPPCGCFTTGFCPLGFAAQTNDLALEYRIASVEVRQGDVLVAYNTAEAPAVVAETKSVRK